MLWGEENLAVQSLWPAGVVFEHHHVRQEVAVARVAVCACGLSEDIGITLGIEEHLGGLVLRTIWSCKPIAPNQAAVCGILKGQYIVISRGLEVAGNIAVTRSIVVVATTTMFVISFDHSSVTSARSGKTVHTSTTMANTVRIEGTSIKRTVGPM